MGRPLEMGLAPIWLGSHAFSRQSGYQMVSHVRNVWTFYIENAQTMLWHTWRTEESAAFVKNASANG